MARHSSLAGGRGRERLVLVGGLLSACALFWAAFASYGHPEQAGESELARMAGEVSDGIVAEWERQRRDPEFFVEHATGMVSWEAPAPHEDAVSFTPREWLGARAPDFAAFDALFGESKHQEYRLGDPEEALVVVLEALDKDRDAPRTAEGRLRAIQLAARLDHEDVARAQWALAMEELDGSEARDGIAYVLLATLAAAPALDEEERAAAKQRLAARWASGRLALPAPIAVTSPAAFTDPLLAVRESLRRRVQELTPEIHAGLDAAPRRFRGHLLTQLVGKLPLPPADGGLGVLRGEGWELVFRHTPERGPHGVFVEPGATAARLAAALTEYDLVPPGFTVDFAGDLDEAGPVVRPRTELAESGLHSPLGYVLRHADPTAIVSGEAKRARLLRAALAVLALFTGIAAVTTARVLRRERALAALKTSFVANVSHELRTPLSSILLMAENLERGLVRGDETQGKYHGLIRREAQRLRRLVDDVLDFSRLERGERLALRIEDVALGEFARELEADVRERVASPGPAVGFRGTGLPDAGCFDVEAVRRAVLNLVDNAVKHAGARRIDVELEGTDAGGLRIRVRDDGVGIAPGRRSEVFAPFARGGKVEANGNGAAGTGLGLAIVREIAEAHGGTAACADPGPQGGALFEIVLPPAAAEAKMEDA